LAETEKRLFQSFIFTADSGSIACNASNPVVRRGVRDVDNESGRPNKWSMMHYANKLEIGPDRTSMSSIPSNG
jgi:hypothetical protein